MHEFKQTCSGAIFPHFNTTNSSRDKEREREKEEERERGRESETNRGILRCNTPERFDSVEF